MIIAAEKISKNRSAPKKEPKNFLKSEKIQKQLDFGGKGRYWAEFDSTEAQGSELKKMNKPFRYEPEVNRKKLCKDTSSKTGS